MKQSTMTTTASTATNYSNRTTLFVGLVAAMAATPLQAFIVSSSQHSAASSYSSSLLWQSKSSERAHIERQLEQAMDNDWREFRAKLVALEQRDNEASPLENEQEKLGDMFHAAVSGFITNDDADTNQPSSSSSESKTEQPTNKAAVAASNQGTTSYNEDPFMSPQELQLYMSASSLNFEKHRWAHALDYLEPGCVLIANEKLGGVFHQTVVLIYDHHVTTGSLGVIINR
jgi:putative transcriptional regulator